MASPTCQVKDGGGGYQQTTNGVNVTPGNTVTINLVSASGVNTWSISCIGTDELSVAATINASLVIDNVAKTATYTAPIAGRAYIFQSVVNGGLNTQTQQIDPTLTTTFGVYTTTGGNRVHAVNEQFESSASFGWTADINALIRNPNAQPDATAGTKGLVQLAGDLAGTGTAAASPRVGNVTGVSGTLTRSATVTSDTGDAKSNPTDTQLTPLLTTDGTVTNIFTFATTTSRTYVLRGFICAQTSTATGRFYYSIEAYFDNNAGTLTQRMASPVTTQHESSASADVTVDVSGTTGRVRVTGLSVTNIRWGGRLFLHEQLF